MKHDVVDTKAVPFDVVSEFSVVNRSQMFLDLNLVAAEADIFLLTGLFHSTSTKKQTLVNSYGIFAGDNAQDPRRGILLRDNEELNKWYLVASPEKAYAPFCENMFKNVKQYFLFWDAILDTENRKKFCSVVKGTQQLACNFPIKWIHDLTKIKFDLRWVGENYSFIFNNINGILHCPSSMVLIDSIIKLNSGMV
jgi:hypothetical protein